MAAGHAAGHCAAGAQRNSAISEINDFYALLHTGLLMRCCPTPLPCRLAAHEAALCEAAHLGPSGRPASQPASHMAAARSHANVESKQAPHLLLGQSERMVPEEGAAGSSAVLGRGVRHARDEVLPGPQSHPEQRAGHLLRDFRVQWVHLSLHLATSPLATLIGKASHTGFCNEAHRT